MAKIVFTQAQQLDLTKRLQLMLLDSLAGSGNWDSARFQGGTCLSLSYGSSRFSEDLDFVLGTDKGLNRMLTTAQARMSNSLRLALPGAQVKFSAREADMEAGQSETPPKNPRTFTMTVSHADWYRVIKVKGEFWVADMDAVAQYQAGVIPAKIASLPLEGVPLRVTLPPVMMPTATLSEIVVDKLHALACRTYMKHRDIFDLWWLAEQGQSNWSEELVARYPYHARMYAGSPTLEGLASILRVKTDAVAAMVGKPEFSEELKKWLGNDSTLASRPAADAMATQVVTHLEVLMASLKGRAQALLQAATDPDAAEAAAAAPRKARPR